MICVSVSGQTEKEMRTLAEPWSFVEYRFDALQSPDEEQAARLVMAVPRCIVTMRPNAEHSDTKRVAMLTAAMEAGAAFIDLEHDMPQNVRKRLVKTAFRCGTEVIASRHNSAVCPDSATFMDQILQMQRDKPEWVKLACRVETQAHIDALLKHVGEEARILPVGTGPLALACRVQLLKKGVAWTWAAADADHRTAEGQPTVAELQAAIEDKAD